MSPPTPPAADPAAVTFAVEYEALLAGNAHNADLTGKGLLVIRPAGPTYTFTGRKRGLFSRRQLTLEFGVDDIWNVVAEGRVVRFATRRGRSAPAGAPFTFVCRDAQDAAAVVALLPTRQDQDFVQLRDFSAQLDALARGRPAWSSVTNLLVAANVAAFVFMGTQGAGWFEAENIMPYIRYGANNGAATTDGEWWRLLTCMFMHYGLIHLGLNMWALFSTGHLLEKLLGRALYALVYLGSGILAGLASIGWHGDRIWSAGASGAVFGVYGALLGFMLREKHGLPRVVFQPMIRSTLGFAAYNILYGLSHPGIDNAAHIGGFLAGIALGWATTLPLDPAARRQLFPRRLQAGLALGAALAAGGIALTPRFDYRLAEELAWGEVVRSISPREGELLKRQEAELKTLRQTGANRSAYAHWLESEVIPAYTGWIGQFEGLALSPQKLTARRRDVILAYSRLQLEAYRHLLAGVRDTDAEEMAAYARYASQAQAELGKLPES